MAGAWMIDRDNRPGLPHSDDGKWGPWDASKSLVQMLQQGYGTPWRVMWPDGPLLLSGRSIGCNNSELWTALNVSEYPGVVLSLMAASAVEPPAGMEVVADWAAHMHPHPRPLALGLVRVAPSSWRAMVQVANARWDGGVVVSDWEPLSEPLPYAAAVSAMREEALRRQTMERGLRERGWGVWRDGYGWEAGLYSTQRAAEDAAAARIAEHPEHSYRVLRYTTPEQFASNAGAHR